MKSGKRSIYKITVQAVFIIISLIYLIPFWLTVVNAFKTAPEAQELNISLPKKLVFGNFARVIEEGNLIKAAINGLVYSLVTVILVILICSMAAYVISRRRDKVSGFIFNYINLGLIVPVAMIPTFLILSTLKLQGTYTGLIIIYTAYSIPFTVFLFVGFIRTVPKELDEAAIVDGAGRLKTFFYVVFPLLKPITVTAGIFTVMNVWNDFSTQLFFGSSDKWSMPLSIYKFFGKYQQSWNLVFADVCLTALPVVIVYVFAQKYIISGMTAGAVKG